MAVHIHIYLQVSSAANCKRTQASRQIQSRPVDCDSENAQRGTENLGTIQEREDTNIKAASGALFSRERVLMSPRRAPVLRRRALIIS